MPWIFSKYIGRRFLLDCLIVSGIFLAILLFASILSTMKDIYGKELQFSTFLQIIFFKLPYLLQEILPFIILIGGIITFNKLTKSSELIVARAAGISAWQFIFPAIVITIIIAIINITIFNSFSASLLTIHEHVVDKYLHKSSNFIAVSKSGVWLRDKIDDQNIIINAKYITQPEMQLLDVSVIILKNYLFVKKISAERASVSDNFLYLEKAIEYFPGKLAKKHQTYQLQTNLQLAKLKDNYAAPETKSLWELPEFILQLKTAGFPALKPRLYFYSLLFSPFLLSAMLLIASSFALSHSRLGKTGIKIISGISFGFVIYFATELVAALALSGRIPLLLAVCTPIIISILIGIALMLHIEDG